MASYRARVLHVNMTNRSSTVEAVPDELNELFVGGRGLGVSYLYKEQPPRTDPLGPDNRLIFLAGPLAGTQAQSVSRWMVCTKSPLTGGYARSVGGADFAAWLRFAGYDVVIVEGQAEKPTYLHLTAEGCQFLDAADLWGLDTAQTQEMIGQKLGDKTRVACIGPAGENS